MSATPFRRLATGCLFLTALSTTAISTSAMAQAPSAAATAAPAGSVPCGGDLSTFLAGVKAEAVSKGVPANVADEALAAP